MDSPQAIRWTGGILFTIAIVGIGAYIIMQTLSAPLSYLVTLAFVAIVAWVAGITFEEQQSPVDEVEEGWEDE